MVIYHQLPHKGIQTLAPYIPGKSAESLAEESGIHDIIKLASNENPLGCSPDVLQALQKLAPQEIATYKITNIHPFRNQLATSLQLDKEMILLSNGSDTIFYYTLVCFALHSGKRIVTHEKAFLQYEIQAKTLGIPVHLTPLKDDMSVDIDALINACTEETAMVFLANPNNPTGLMIPQAEIKRLLSHIPSNIIMVLDEAYFEYLPKSEQSDVKQLLQQYPNLIVTRTFSKIYGLASLRLGYALANPELIGLLYRIQLPFIVNLAAFTAAAAALEDTHFVEQSILNNNEGMQMLKQGFAAQHLKQLPSACNFITVNTGHSANLVDQHLQKKGIIIRPLNSYGLPQYIRVTIGTPAQNQRFLNTLSNCLEELNYGHSCEEKM